MQAGRQKVQLFGQDHCCWYGSKTPLKHAPKGGVYFHSGYAELSTIIRQRPAEVAASGLQPHGKQLQSSQSRPARRVITFSVKQRHFHSQHLESKLLVNSHTYNVYSCIRLRCLHKDFVHHHDGPFVIAAGWLHCMQGLQDYSLKCLQWLKLGVPVEGLDHVLHVVKTSCTKSVHVAQVVWL